MDLRSLSVFVEVVRRGGFTAASSKVALTQPSISRVIKQLEDDVGQTLLNRQHRSIVLTEAGKILYRHAQNLLRDHSALETELADLSGLKRGSLSLGIPPLSGTLFVPLIKRYKQKYPDIELILHEKGSKATERALLGADMQLGTLILPLDNALYDSVPVFRDRLALAAPLNSVWAKRTDVKLSELKDEPFIIFPEDFALNDTVRNACAEAGFEPEIAASSSHFSFIAGLIDS
ncbi:MAG TPA: LysR family transcriptional regulator, partial [Verrucomicrobium sp.]|nr:LysR family transcriptional regulator [Verrucomicrobium sp.]